MFHHERKSNKADYRINLKEILESYLKEFFVKMIDSSVVVN